MWLSFTWVAQFVGASSCTPKGCGFDLPSAHIPRVQVQSPVRANTRGNQLMFLSHSLRFSLSLCLSLRVSLSPFLSLWKINKYILQWGLKIKEFVTEKNLSSLFWGVNLALIIIIINMKQWLYLGSSPIYKLDSRSKYLMSNLLNYNQKTCLKWLNWRYFQ